VANLFFLKIKTQYFAESSQLNSFLHCWSLGVEEQFYFVFPFFAYAFLSGSRKMKRIIVTLLVGIVAASLLAFSLLGGPRVPAAYFLMPTRLWELGVGCLLAIGSSNSEAKTFRWIPPPSALLVGLFALFYFGDRFPTFSVIASVLIVALLIKTIQPESFAYRVLTHPWSVFIGKMSYSLYLWHFAVFALSQWTIGITATTIPLQLGLVAVLSFLSYRFIEKPFRSPSWTLHPRLSLGLGFGSVLLAGVTVLGLILFWPSLSFEQKFNEEILKQQEGEENWGRNPDEGCHFSYEFNPGKVKKCLHVEESSRRRLFILGDSHAFQFVDSIKNGLGPDWDIIYFTAGWGCGVVSEKDIDPKPPIPTFICAEYIRAVDKLLASSVRSKDVVLVAHHWEKYPLPHAREALAAVAEKIEKRGAKLILTDDNATLKVESPLQCEVRKWRHLPPAQCWQSLESIKEQQKPFEGIASDLIRKFSCVRVAWLKSLYCEAKTGLCGASLNGTLIYSDKNHLNAAGAKIGAAEIIKTILAD
jgi:hypothetical protein